MCSNEAFFDECRAAACGIAILPVNSQFLGIFVRYRPFLVVSSLERVFGQHKSLLMQTNETRKSNYFSATNTHAFFWTSSCHLYRGVDLTFWFQQKARFCFSFCLSCLIVCIVDGCSEGTAMFFFCENMLFRRRGMCFVPHRLYALWYVCIANDRVPFFSLFAVFFLCSSLLGRVFYLWTVRDHDTLFLPMCFLFCLGVCSTCALPFATGGEIAYEASRQVGHVWFPGSSQLSFPALTL